MIEVVKKSNHINNLEITCSKCQSLLRFNIKDSHYSVGFDFMSRFKMYGIECPVCHRDICIGKYDYLTDKEEHYFKLVDEEESNERP